MKALRHRRERRRRVKRVDECLRGSASTPLAAFGQSAPTAKKRLATATPRAPFESRATMDQVMPTSTQKKGGFACHENGGLTQARGLRRN